MGLRVEIQKRLIALFRVPFDKVVYNSEGIPSIEGTEIPKVLCNEVSGSLQAETNTAKKYSIKNWSFEVLLDFSQEVDTSDILMNLPLVSFSYNDVILVKATENSGMTANHPVHQGSTAGTQVKISFTFGTKK